MNYCHNLTESVQCFELQIEMQSHSSTRLSNTEMNLWQFYYTDFGECSKSGTVIISLLKLLILLLSVRRC